VNVFPDITPSICRRGYNLFQNRVQAADGSSQINVPHPVIQYLFHLEYAGADLGEINLDTIEAHIRAAGTVLGWTFFDFNVRAFQRTQIGTGNGTIKTFTLPAKSVATTGLVIDDNGVAKVNGTDFTLNVGTGAEGEDQITFGTAPLNTHGIFFTSNRSADVQGFLQGGCRARYFVNYVSTQFTPARIEADLYNLVIELEMKV
jgi:hypothetical protein